MSSSSNRSRSKTKQPHGGLVYNIKTIVIAVVIAFGLRTVLYEPFNIPSGSMIPTLQVGDYLFVSKYSYGYSRFSLPLSPDLFSGRIFGRVPERGDVAVFRLPRDTSIDYVKRIVGLPGDRIQMIGGILHINGQPVRREAVGGYLAQGDGPAVQTLRYIETLPGGRQHSIIEYSDREMLDNTPEYRVPEGYVFGMGDNRDDSQDSRVMNAVGFIPMENLIGRAEFIFFSIDRTASLWQPWTWPFAIRWSRLLSVVR